MSKNLKNITAKLIVIFMTITMFNFNYTVESKAATNSSYENELLSIINKYGEENVIVGNGIVLEIGENKELDYNNWISNNESIIKVEDTNLSGINEGTTFLVRENDGKAYIEEVQVTTINPTVFSANERASDVNRNYYKVFLDPGHGGADPGAVANGVKEKDLNLIISEKVKTKLQNKNVEVMTSRSSDVTVELGERAKMANAYGADTFVSIHQNSATASASGIETFYQETKTQYVPYASKIQNALIANTGAINRGTKPEDFNVLRTSNMPSALVECGFITNSNDVSKLKTDSYREAIANAIANSIYSYLVENINLTPAREDGVAYSTHIEDYGWQNNRYNGQMSGTSAQAKRLEAIKINLENIIPGGSIEYRTHIEDIGWQGWKSNGEISGTSGQSKRLEGIEIKLDNAPGYSVKYRVHVEDYGWQDWKVNGQTAGTVGEAKRLEAIEIRVVRDIDYNLKYTTHVEEDGWQSWKTNGQTAGTSGQAKRLEGIKIDLVDAPAGTKILYQVHVQDYGWQDWKTSGQVAGTEGESKRLEAIKIKIENSHGYKVQYRTHIEDIGWQEWKSEGEIAGTQGQSKRLEAIEIRLVE